MAGYITIFDQGGAGQVPLQTTWTWLGGNKVDTMLIKLHDGLKLSELMFVSDVKHIEISAKPLILNYKQTSSVLISEVDRSYDTGYVQLTYNNTDMGKVITSKMFNITIRNVNTGEEYSTITVKFSETADTDRLTPLAISSEVTSNDIYGVGTTEKLNGDTLLFTRLNTRVTNIKETVAIENTVDKDFKPYSKFTPLTSNILTIVSDTANSNIEQRNNKWYSDTPLTITPKANGFTPIRRVPTLKDKKDGKVSAEGFQYALVQTLATTSNLEDTTELRWNETKTLLLDNSYPLVDIAAYEYDNIENTVNKLVAVFENKNKELIKIFPYVRNDRFYCKIMACNTNPATASLAFTLHNTMGWDNGNYVTKELNFNIVNPGDNKCPIDVLDKTITLLVGESKQYKVFTLSGKYNALVLNSTIAGIDQDVEYVTGLTVGETIIRISTTQDGWDENSIDIKVIVKDLPTSSFSVDKKVDVVALGDTVNFGVIGSKADDVSITSFPTDSVKSYNILEKTDSNTKYSGSVVLRGMTEGVSTVVFNSKFRNVITESIQTELHVVRQGSYKLIPSLTPITLDINKNAVKGVELTVITNAPKINYELPDDPGYTIKDIVNNGKTFSCKLFPGTKRVDSSIKFIGLTMGDDRLTWLDIPVNVTRTANVKSSEIWLTLEHKQLDVKDEDNSSASNRHFTVFKWINRETLDDVYGHRLILPNRNGTLLSKKLVDDYTTTPRKYFEYATNTDPARNTNPYGKDVVWLNTATSEIWKCVDDEKDNNHWISNLGRQIAPSSKMYYPLPGEPGFGCGNMSCDLHPHYGLEPLEGCYIPTHANYGNYKDKNGNIFVYVPKHYVRINQGKGGKLIETIDTVYRVVNTKMYIPRNEINNALANKLMNTYVGFEYTNITNPKEICLWSEQLVGNRYIIDPNTFGFEIDFNGKTFDSYTINFKVQRKQEWDVTQGSDNLTFIMSRSEPDPTLEVDMTVIRGVIKIDVPYLRVTPEGKWTMSVDDNIVATLETNLPEESEFSMKSDYDIRQTAEPGIKEIGGVITVDGVPAYLHTNIVSMDDDEEDFAKSGKSIEMGPEDTDYVIVWSNLDNINLEDTYNKDYIEVTDVTNDPNVGLTQEERKTIEKDINKRLGRVLEIKKLN